MPTEKNTLKLTDLKISNYKSIEDSGWFSIDDMTCLAGKNEAGKTAILQALGKLNPIEGQEDTFGATIEYPRQRLADFNKNQRKPDQVLDTRWELDQEDISAIEQKLGQGSVSSNVVKVSKGYSSTGRTWSIELDEFKILEHFSSKTSPLTEPASHRVQEFRTIVEAVDAIGRNSNATTAEKELRELLSPMINPEQTPHKIAISTLKVRLPKFLYFDSYETMPGFVRVDQLQQRMAEDKPLDQSDRLFLALLSIAGTKLDDITGSTATEESIALLEAAGASLTLEVFKYWTQNKNLRVRVEYAPAKSGDPAPFNEGHVFSIRIENTRHYLTLPFDQRSAGFVWFFSFLVLLQDVELRLGDRLFILLDEPGLNLHGRAQIDLLGYIKDELLPKYQVMYTTHSPFMIDTKNILSVRTVEDTAVSGTGPGTQVSGDVLSSDSDTLFPLRSALGYDITQSLFVGRYNLLVEGPSDLLYLQWASSELRKLGRGSLDNNWTICPVGGSTR